MRGFSSVRQRCSLMPMDGASARRRVFGAGTISRVFGGGVLGCAVALLAAPVAPAVAGLLRPQLLGSPGATNAVNVGAAMGPDRAWVGLVQTVGGVKRLYADFARNGRFAAPVVADRGNAVVSAGLAGDASGGSRGNAVLAWTELGGNVHVLFARSLTSDGRLGPVVQVSTANQDAVFDGADMVVPFDRTHAIAMNDTGEAALCYFDAAGMQSFLATLAPSSNQWVTHQMACSDPHIDAAGDVFASVGADANNKFSAAMLIGGQVRNEIIDPNVAPGDEFAAGLGAGGTALALGRDNNQKPLVYRKANLASSGAWQDVGPLDGGLIPSGFSLEDPFAALDARGNGIVVFRDNNNNNPQGYYRSVVAGTPMGGAVLDHSMSRLRPVVNALGTAFVAYSAADFKSGFLNIFKAGVPGSVLPLAPGLGPYDVPSLTSIAVDPGGDVLVLLSVAGPPQTVAAVFGDFSSPTLRPVVPRHIRAGHRVLLRSGATDAFADPSNSKIRWKLPSAVRGRRSLTGLRIHVTFRKRGRFRIIVTASDPQGHRTSKTLTVRVS
jgi:hypothetical protein